MAVRALPSPALLLAAALAGCHPAPPREALDRDQLAVQLRQVASLGAEAVMFTDEVASGHLAGAYAWTQQQALAAEAGHIAGELAQPAPPQLREPQRIALQLATALQLELTRIAPAQRHPDELRALRERFSALQAQAKALGTAP